MSTNARLGLAFFAGLIVVAFLFGLTVGLLLAR